MTETETPLRAVEGDLGTLTQSLLAIDAILIKASGADQINQRDPGYAYRMAIELRLFRALHRTYTRRVEEGTKAAASWLMKRSWPDLTAQDVTGVGKRMREAMDGWAEEVQPVLSQVVKEAYLQGKQTIWARAIGVLLPRPVAESPRIVQGPKGRPVIKAMTRAQIKPSFTLVDQNAVQALEGRSMFWIGRHYDQNLSERIRLVSQQTIIEQGLGRREAARALMTELPAAMGMTQGELVTAIPIGWTGTSVQYMEGIAANTVTTARVAGSFRGLREVGASQYVVVNPSDRRTCLECDFMNGKVFYVDDGAARMDEELAAGDPMAVKGQHPWHKLPTMLSNTGLKASDTGKVSGRKASALSKGGYGFPSYHFRCRCTIDIAAGTSFGPPAEVITVPQVAKPKVPTTIVPKKLPAMTLGELDKGLKSFAQKEWGTKFNATEVILDSADMPKGAWGVHDWSGRIHLDKVRSRHLRSVLRTRSIDNLDEAQAFRTLFHEHIHGLGKWKGQGDVAVTRAYAQAYVQPAGRLLEEGCTELLASDVFRLRRLLAYLKIEDKAGMTGSALGGEPIWARAWIRYKSGTRRLVTKHVYQEECAVVEALCQLGTGGNIGGRMTKATVKMIDELAHTWSPGTRVRMLSDRIAKGMKLKGDLAKRYSKAIQMRLDGIGQSPSLGDVRRLLGNMEDELLLLEKEGLLTVDQTVRSGEAFKRVDWYLEFHEPVW